MVPKTFGEWIRQTRQGKQPPWTLAELARRAHKSAAYLSNLEHDTSLVQGKTRRPRVETVDMVAEALAENPEQKARFIDEARAIAGYAPPAGPAVSQGPYAAGFEAVETHNRLLESMVASHEGRLLDRITVNTDIFGGKPIIRGKRLAVEHVLGMLAAGDTEETLREAYPWLQREDIQACLAYARRMVARERIEPFLFETGA
jgi:uncharacterized protein (DUF433 family)